MKGTGAWLGHRAASLTGRHASGLSLLGRVRPDALRLDPFPHFVVDGVLPEDLFARLADRFPPDAAILDGRCAGENERVDLPARRSLASRRIDPAWRRFVAYHTSPAFFAEACRLFAAALPRDRAAPRDWSPPDWAVLGRRPTCGIRGRGARRGAAVTLDCNIGINTPATTSSSVRGPHLASPLKLFTMLLYFGDPADLDAGGDLQLYAPGSGPVRARAGAELAADTVALHTTLACRANRAVIFPNGPTAIHGVSPRAPSPRSRRLVNVVAEGATPLFQLPERQARA